MGITVADLVLAGVLILGILYGWRWGTINVVAKVGALVLAYQAARTFSGMIAEALVQVIPPFNANIEQAADGASNFGDQALNVLSLFINTSGAANRLVQIVVFIVIFILVNWLVRKIAYALTGIFGRGILGQLNKAIGAFVALLLAIVLIIVFTDIILPVCINIGFGDSVLAFLNRSAILLPFMRSLPTLL